MVYKVNSDLLPTDDRWGVHCSQTLTTVHHDNWEQDYTEYIDGHLIAYMTTYFKQHIV